MVANSILDRIKFQGSRLASDASGNVGLLFAMTLIPAALLAGGTVDVGNVLWNQARLQVAADSAALAAVAPKDASNDQRREIAQSLFKANIAGTPFAGAVPEVTISGDTVTVTASLDVATPFLNVIRIDRLPANANARATGRQTISNTVPGKACILALDPDSDDGIHLQGDNQVNYQDCWAHTNSKRPTAINAVGANAKAVGKGHCASGGYQQTHDTFTPTPKSACPSVPDPFAYVGAYEMSGIYRPKFTAPARPETCKANNLKLKKGAFTLDPGRYCGGIDIQAGATVTLNPGVYYIDDGVFNVQSGASVKGSNVLLYLAGTDSRLQIIGGGTTELSGRTTGSSYQGFLVIAHPDANRFGESNIQGGGVFRLTGVIYLPTQRVEVSGNGDVNDATVQFFGLVAKDFYFRGNGVFNARKHGGGSVPDIMPNIPVEERRDAVLM